MQAVIVILQNFIASFYGLFFLITGQALFTIYDGNLIGFYKKTIKYLLLPFFIGTWILLMLQIGFSVSLTFAMDLLKAFVTNSLEERYWMPYTVMGICLIAPFISIMLNSLSEKERRVLLYLIIGYFAFFSLAIWFQIGIAIASYPFLNWMAYGIVGWLMTKISWSKRELNVIKEIGIVALIVSSIEAVVFPGVNWCLDSYCLTRIFICMLIYQLGRGIKGKKSADHTVILAEGVYILALIFPIGAQIAEKLYEIS